LTDFHKADIHKMIKKEIAKRWINMKLLKHKDYYGSVEFSAEDSCKGSFNIRIGSELHRNALICAKSMGINLNEFVKNSIEKAIHI